MTTTSTTPAVPATSTPAASSTQPAETEREIAFEHLVAGRLTLQVLRNQLDTQIAGLHAQLLVAESQLRQTEDMLERTDAKLARQHPDKVAPSDHASDSASTHARGRTRAVSEPGPKQTGTGATLTVTLTVTTGRSPSTGPAGGSTRS